MHAQGFRTGSLTDGEISLIKALAGKGFPPSGIAERLNRTPSTIQAAMKRLGLSTERKYGWK